METRKAKKTKAIEITLSERGDYHCYFGKGALHAWVAQEAVRRGCESVPEFVRQVVQEAFVRSNAQQCAG